MISTRRGFLRGLVAAVAATALPMPVRWMPDATAAGHASAPVHAASLRLAQTAEWVPILPDVGADQLYTPASGPLFAATSSGLLRSDDAGMTWAAVAAPT